MAQKKRSKLVNAKARFDYELGDRYVAGIVLTGAEVSSIRHGRVSMRGTFVTIRDGEAWLNNLEIAALPSNAHALQNINTDLPHKLLLKQSELSLLIRAKDSGMTIVPTKLIPGRYIKIEISVAKGKKQHDKRAHIKEREQNREARRIMKHRGR